MKKNTLIVLACIMTVGIIGTTYVVTYTPKWLIWMKLYYPLEHWEVNEQWKKDGRDPGDMPGYQPMSNEMRGKVEMKSPEWWLYRNNALGFEMEFPVRKEDWSADQLKQFEHFLDESPYNKSYQIELSSMDKYISVEVRGTRFRSLKKWYENGLISDFGFLLLDKETQSKWETVGEEWQWTTISGYPALIHVEGYMQLLHGLSLTFEQRGRGILILKQGKLYILNMMYVPKIEYQRMLGSFKLL